MERGETLEEAGEPAQWVAYVERGCFKYMVHNDEEGKDYCTGFAFEGEFVSDFPYCLDGDLSEVSIEADMPCEVRVISGQELQALIDNDPKMAKMDVKILKNLFKMVYGRDLDHYRYTARSCYRRLIDRCPQVVQMLSLKDTASLQMTQRLFVSLQSGKKRLLQSGTLSRFSLLRAIPISSTAQCRPQTSTMYLLLLMRRVLTMQ